jgi:hypothetical protein
VWVDNKPKMKPIIDAFNGLIETDVHNLLEIDKEYKV